MRSRFVFIALAISFSANLSATLALAQTQTSESNSHYFNPYEILLLPLNDLTLDDKRVYQAFQEQIKLIDTDKDSEASDQLLDAYHALQTRDKREAYLLQRGEIKFLLDTLKLKQKILNPNSSKTEKVLSIIQGASTDLEYVVLDNPFKRIWSGMNKMRRTYTLAHARGEKLELAVLNLIIGLEPFQNELRDQVRKLLLERFNGNNLALANFIFYTIKTALESVDPRINEISRAGHALHISPRQEVIEFLTLLLIDQNDYWSVSALLDLEKDFEVHPIRYRDHDNWIASFRIIQSYIKLMASSPLLKAYKSIRPLSFIPRTFYAATCGILLEPYYGLRKAPF